MEADLAILCCGAVSVAVYPSLAAHEIGYILHDSGCSAVFIENFEQLQKLRQLAGEEIEIPATEERPQSHARVAIGRMVAFDPVEAAADVMAMTEILSGDELFPPAAVPITDRNSLASLVYTSGTTGPPKGVMQTHGNHLSNVRQAMVSGLVSSGNTIMVFLPLAHSFARLMGYIGFLTDCALKFPAIPDRRSSKMHPDSVTRDIREGSANILPIVPRILEKMQEGVIARGRQRSAAGRVVGATVSAAQAVYKAADIEDLSFFQRLIYQLSGPIRRLIKLKLFGPNFLYAVSGGAKLNPEIARFFDALGIIVLEGYGLTETCVATNANRLAQRKIGTVGPRLDQDIEVRIAEDSEILFRGPNVSVGYFNRPAATRASWDADGWFHTGDLGSLDADDFLKIEGRKKELIVTSYGKKIAPEPIENQLKMSPLISQAVMVGDGRAYCCVLIVPDRLHLREHPAGQAANLESDPAVRALFEAEIVRVNAELASFEQIKRFVVLDQDFTIENGLLTPTFKVRRREVSKRFAAEIEALYS